MTDCEAGGGPAARAPAPPGLLSPQSLVLFVVVAAATWLALAGGLAPRASPWLVQSVLPGVAPGRPVLGAGPDSGGPRSAPPAQAQPTPPPAPAPAPGSWSLDLGVGSFRELALRDMDSSAFKVVYTERSQVYNPAITVYGGRIWMVARHEGRNRTGAWTACPDRSLATIRKCPVPTLRMVSFVVRCQLDAALRPV